LKYVGHNYAPMPLVITKGEGIYITDVEGKRYMDFIAGIGSVN
jgi:ornithine--oxo-acid transaminase